MDTMRKRPVNRGAFVRSSIIPITICQLALHSAVVANAVAAVAFAVFGPVRWAFVAPLAVGFLVGGWVGPAIVRRLPERLLRLIVGVAGLAIAVKLGVSAYR